MNRITDRVVYTIAVILLLWACTKQVGLVTEVEFSLLEDHVAEGYVNQSLSTTVTVVPEELLEGYEYTLSYKVLTGEGHFEDGSGAIVPQGENQAMATLSKSWQYIGSTVGNHTVRVKAEDTYGFTEELELTYTLSEVPVTWTASSADTQLLIGSSTAITVTLGNEGMENASYERNYGVAPSLGTLSETDASPVALGTYVAIVPGTYQYDFVADALGTVVLTFDLRDSNGQQLTATLTLEVVEEVLSDGNDILAFSLPGQMGASTIDAMAHTVMVNVPMGTVLDTAPTALTLSTGATVDPAADIQRDFSAPVVYTVTAENGDAQAWTITVVSEADMVAPVITLIGGAVTLSVGEPYVEPGYSANDDVDGDISANVTIGGDIDSGTVGTYQLTYNVSDAAGNAANEVLRTVTVTDAPDATAPVITLVGGAMTLTVGETYVEPGYSAFDDVDGDITANVMVGGIINTGTAGTYQLTYNVSDAAGNAANEVVRVVTINAEANQAPTAIATVDITSGAAPLTVNFDNQGSFDSDGIIVLTNWDFGDGSPGNTGGFPTSVSHTFNAPGTYDVVLTVTDDGNPSLNDTITVTITVTSGNTPPVAVATADVTTGIAPLTVNFTGSGSMDDSSILAYNWEFSDVGGPSSDQNPVHTFSTPGTYDVILTVMDDGSPALSDTANITITVSAANQNPTAVATANITSGNTPLDVTFDGSTSSDPDGTIGSYLWNFDDNGNSSISATPTYTFSTPGTYNVELTVTDDGTPALSHTTSNSPPVAMNDSFTVLEGGVLNANVLSNNGNGADIDADGDAFFVSHVNGVTAQVGQTVNASNGGQLYITSDGAMGFYQNNGEFDDLNDGETRLTTATYQITDGSSFSNTATVSITVIGTGSPNTPPNAVATADVTTGIAPLTVNFTGSGSTDDGNIIIYNWEFSDVGGPSAVQNPVHTFSTPGTYDVILTVTDDGTPALSDTASITITVSAANNAPTAVANSDIIVGDAPLTVNFNGSGSDDTDGTIVLTNWDFDDGPGNTGGFPTAVSHTFNTPGTYNVVLTVTDNEGATGTDMITITVNSPSPSASFSGGTNISTSGSVSGVVTISNGPMAFTISAYGGSGGTSITFTIDGTPYSVSALEGQSASMDTPSFAPGTYNYVLSGTFGGSSGNGGNVSAFIP